MLISPAVPLQSRSRTPPPSFTSPHPEGLSLGFLLERERCIATTQTEGGLKTDCWEMDVCPCHGLEGPVSQVPDSCYTVVQPGLQSGSMYMELLVQSMRPSSKGMSGLNFWVVSMCCLRAQTCARL